MRARFVNENWQDILPQGVSGFENEVELIDVVDGMEEYLKEYRTAEEFMDDYELTGDIMMAKGDWEGDDDFPFYCGPSIGNGNVSDSIHIDGYLKKLCNELDIPCDIGAAENYHTFFGK